MAHHYHPRQTFCTKQVSGAWCGSYRPYSACPQARSCGHNALTRAVASTSLQMHVSLLLPGQQQRRDEHRLYSFLGHFLRIHLSPEIVSSTSCHPVQCRKNFLPSSQMMHVNMFLTAVCFTLNIQRGVKLKRMNKDRKALYL